MSLDSKFGKALMIAVVCALAILMGNAVSDPLSSNGMTVAGGILLVMALPILMRWHEPMLIVGWNLHMVLFFLKTDPAIRDVLILWSMLMFGVGVAMDKRSKPRFRDELVAPAAVILIGTWIAIFANHGPRALMNEGLFGGKRYLFVMTAILGVFVLAAVKVPPKWRQLAAFAFFFSGVSYAIGDFLYLVGAPGFVEALFPSMIGFYDRMALGELSRFAGIGWAAMSIVFCLQLKFGVRGILDMSRPWRGAAYLFFMLVSTLGGHRIAVVLPVMVFMIQFVMEGMFMTRYTLYLGIAAALVLGVSIAFSDSMPFAVQRALSFLPGKRSALVVSDAEGSWEWRLEMWQRVLPEVPKYFWTGKGFLYSPADENIAQFGMMNRMFRSYEGSMVDGTYHQGILTVLLPLGVVTFAGFVWLVWVGISIMRRNLRYGDPKMRRVNMFLLSIMLGRCLLYVFIYGQFETDLQMFCGLIGLSLVVNGGVATEPKHVPLAGLEAESQGGLAVIA